MALLNAFKTQQQALEFIFPGKSPINASPQRMNGRVK
jgi:hypothetical protein